MKENIFAKAAKAFEMPGEIIAGLPKIQIVGCQDIYIENHKGILSYDSKEISVNGGGVVLRIKGDGFVISAMSASELRVLGTLFSIEVVY